MTRLHAPHSNAVNATRLTAPRFPQEHLKYGVAGDTDSGFLHFGHANAVGSTPSADAVCPQPHVQVVHDPKTLIDLRHP